jgi:hypothetical protein
MMWVNSRSCLPALANQMQILCFHLAFIQNPPPSAAPYPGLTPSRFSMYHIEKFKNWAKYTQSHGILGKKAFVNQIDGIL